MIERNFLGNPRKNDEVEGFSVGLVRMEIMKTLSVVGQHLSEVMKDSNHGYTVVDSVGRKTNWSSSDGD